MKLVVGLGNPEKKYDGTYHNLGFMTVDKFALENDIEFNKKGCKSVFGEGEIDGESVIVAKPLTYMNLSGEAVLAFKSKYKLQNKDILVVVDDIDLPLGTYRYKTGGSGGTHNGMRNIVSMIGTDFPRLRIGIGKPENIPLIDFVLQKIRGKNLEILEEVTDELTDIIKRNLGARANPTT